MGDQSAIQWTDATWNPVTGCSKVSPGCAHCYAERVAIRLWPSQYPPVACDPNDPRTAVRDAKRIELLGATGVPGLRFREFTDVQCHEDRLDQPLRWEKPRKIFVNSMSDLFHEDVPDAFIDRVFAVMALAPQHTFQILTKRAERMRDYMTCQVDGWGRGARIASAAQSLCGFDGKRYDHTKGIRKSRALLALPNQDVFWIGACNPPDQPYRERWILKQWPLSNVWLGVSVENQHFMDERMPLLLQTPAAVRFLSCEPLLEGLDLAKHRPGANRLWVIVGGESGAGARPCEVAWIRSIVRQCQESDTPVFVKQLGARPVVPAGRQQHWEWGGAIGREARFKPTDKLRPSSAPWRVVLRNRKGGDMAEWPEVLRVREMPGTEGCD